MTTTTLSTSFSRATWAMTKRWLWRMRRAKSDIILSLIQPAVWLILFGNLFADSQVVSDYSYIAFMTAGVVIMTVFNGALNGGVELLFDRETGLLQRLMAAPIPATSLLASRLIVVVCVTTTQALLILLVALAMGVRLASGGWGILLILLVGALLGVGITAVSMALAFGLANHSQFFAIIGFLSLPLIFASNALAPLEIMPTWLQKLAQLNPLTYAITSCRQLILYGFDWETLLQMGIVIGLFDVVASIACLWVLRRTTG